MLYGKLYLNCVFETYFVFLSVLSTVRMQLLDPEFLNNEILNNKIVKASIECQDLVEKARSFQSIQNTFKNTVRQCPDVPGIIYAVGGFGSSRPNPQGQQQSPLRG